MKNFLTVGVLLFLLSCANPYAQFYQGIPDARIQPSYESINSELKIYRTDNVDLDAQALMRRGYSPIGHSSFNAASNSVTPNVIDS